MILTEKILQIVVSLKKSIFFAVFQRDDSLSLLAKIAKDERLMILNDFLNKKGHLRVAFLFFI